MYPDMDVVWAARMAVVHGLAHDRAAALHGTAWLIPGCWFCFPSLWCCCCPCCWAIPGSHRLTFLFLCVSTVRQVPHIVLLHAPPDCWHGTQHTPAWHDSSAGILAAMAW